MRLTTRPREKWALIWCASSGFGVGCQPCLGSQRLPYFASISMARHDCRRRTGCLPTFMA